MLGGRKDGAVERKLLKSRGKPLLGCATASGCVCLFYVLTSFLLVPAQFFKKQHPPARKNLELLQSSVLYLGSIMPSITGAAD